MDSLGVWKMRIIRTSEAPRWKENAGDAALGLTEYYDRMLEFASAYMKTGCRMDVIIWQFFASVSCIWQLWDDSCFVPGKGIQGFASRYARGSEAWWQLQPMEIIFPVHQLSGTTN